jgi:hypothetical protein
MLQIMELFSLLLILPSSPSSDGLSSLACSHSELILKLRILQAIDRIPWTGDQPVPKPLPINEKYKHRKNYEYIHTSSGIRTYGPTSLYISCLRRPIRSAIFSFRIKIFSSTLCSHQLTLFQYNKNQFDDHT